MEGLSVIDFMKKGHGPMKRVVAAALAASMFAGCAKVQEAINSVSNKIKPNIVGKVTSSGGATMMKAVARKAASGKTVPIFGRKLPVVSQSVEGDGVSGCTVTARDLQTGAVIATGTSGSDGTYVIESDSITAGDSYRVVATCGTGPSAVSFAAVTSADTQDPDEKEPVSTNARSTLIAAQIIEAVLEALEAAVQSIPGASDAVKDSIKQAVLEAVDTIIAQVSAVIEEAIESGAMQEPSDTVATEMTAAVDDATTAADADDAAAVYEEDVGSIPESVGNATAGAAKAASALPACDSSLNAEGETPIATQAGCTQAVAKLLYSLGFSVAVNTGSGGSFDGESCASTNADMLNAFPGAEFQDLSEPPADGENRPQIAGACFVRSKTAKVNRNEGYDDKGGEEDDTVFVESFSSSEITGLLSKIAQSMLANYQYSLNNIDQILFSHDAGAQAGMNMKLIFQSKEFNQDSAGFGQSYKYRNASGSWVDIPCGEGGCALWQMMEAGFADMTWGSCNAALGSPAKLLATNIGSGDFVGDVMSAQYSGPVPTQSQLESFFNERSFVDNNPTGEKEFHVLFEKDPRWVNPGDVLPAPATGTDTRPASCTDAEPESGTPCPNGCFDNDPSTKCYAVGSTLAEVTPVQVNVQLGAAITLSGDSKGFRPMTSITGAPGTGAYFIRPIFGPSGFLGAGQLISASTGKLLRDDFMRPRTFLVYDSGVECPSGISCADGNAYNVDLEWSCGGDGPCEPEMKAITGATSTISMSEINAEVKSEYRSRWEEIHADEDKFGHSAIVVGQGEWKDLSVLTVKVNPATAQITLTGKASSLPDVEDDRYAVSPVWNCSNEGCSVGGFYLVNKNGVPFSPPSDSFDGKKWEPGKVCWVESGNWTCGAEVIRFGVGDDSTWVNLNAGSPDYDTETGGAQSFDDVAASIRVPSGPAANPSHKCSFNPYYVETGTANEKLDCNEGDAAATSGDVSFSNMWEFDRWRNDPANAAHASAELKKNANGYRFSNPAAVKNLMNTAFPGWFDGSHTIDSSTRFNALQVFSLIYLFFEGNGSDGLHVEGLAPDGEQGGFMPMSPVMSGGDNVPSFNKAFGNGLTTFKQATN